MATPASAVLTSTQVPNTSLIAKIGTLSSGGYMALACISGVLLANTPAGPYATALLGLALIYQTSQLLQGK